VRWRSAEWVVNVDIEEDRAAMGARAREASKDDAEVNVGEVQAVRESVGVTKTNAENTEDVDAEAAESATGGMVPPNEVASAETEEVDAAPEE
jgi:hypothetical protein